MNHEIITTAAEFAARDAVRAAARRIRAENPNDTIDEILVKLKEAVGDIMRKEREGSKEPRNAIANI